MATYQHNLSAWQCPSISLRQQDVYTHIMPANFASDKERTG